MYVIQLFRDGKWESWGSAASPKLVNQYLDLLNVLHPKLPIQVVPPK